MCLRNTIPRCSWVGEKGIHVLSALFLVIWKQNKTKHLFNSEIIYKIYLLINLSPEKVLFTGNKKYPDNQLDFSSNTGLRRGNGIQKNCKLTTISSLITVQCSRKEQFNQEIRSCKSRARSAKLFFSLGGIPEEGWAVIQDGVDSVNEGNTIKVKQDKCRGGHWCAGNNIMWKSASCPLRTLFLVQAAWNQKGCSQGVSWRY